jgi:predicted tellurium resistance membrane protein TerC
MKNIYSWLLLGLVAFDTAMTLIVIKYFGAAEANPFMVWLMAKSILLFIGFKMGTVGAYIGLVQRSGKLYYIKFAFWACLVIYCVCTLGLNYRGYL